MRSAIIDTDGCQPKRCSVECIKFCPGVRMGDETVVFREGEAKPAISEELCTGCGICVHKCPFEAISIINLPDELGRETIQSYGENSFRCYRLPYPQEKAVTGLIGANGIGKTTILNILSGNIVPNLGRYEQGVDGEKEAVLEHFAGTQFSDYFSGLYEGELKVAFKPQYVDSLPKVARGKVKTLLKKVDEKGEMESITGELEIENAIDRYLSKISGGELQRVAIAAALLKEADVYIFDEPSSYLDVRQRLNVARVIRGLAKESRVVVVEHDLIVLDYLADYVAMMYGTSGAYGIVSHPRGVKKGINVYLGGYLREENIRFRKEPLRFEVRPPSKGWESEVLVGFTQLIKTYNGFSLVVKEGEVHKGEVIGVLGPNATGKTTFMKMLAGVLDPDEGKKTLEVKVSYKPQYIKPETGKTVLKALEKAEVGISTPGFEAEIAGPLNLKPLLEMPLDELSGGELQRVAIALCLGREADVYLLDEPSAYLDVEERLNVAKMVRRRMEKREATAIVVDHDILFADYISDRLMVFSGIPGQSGAAKAPMEMEAGMNRFLKEVEVTFRRDLESGRPRANKPESRKDREQKASGAYYYSK